MTCASDSIKKTFKKKIPFMYLYQYMVENGYGKKGQKQYSGGIHLLLSKIAANINFASALIDRTCWFSQLSAASK